MNQTLSGLETNMIVLLSVLLLLIISKFVACTIAVHRTNLKIQQKLGKEAFEWLIFDKKKVEDEHLTEENIKELVNLITQTKYEFVTNLVSSIESVRKNQVMNKIVKAVDGVSMAMSFMNVAISKTGDSFRKFGTIIQSIKGLKNEI